jgi:hypothetical protein
MQDTIPIKEDCPQEEVLALINRILEEYRRGGTGASAKELPENLLRDLKRSGWRWLSRKTYSQLSRWCDPGKPSPRNDFVQAKARKISQALFGEVIPRVQG